MQKICIRPGLGLKVPGRGLMCKDREGWQGGLYGWAETILFFGAPVENGASQAVRKRRGAALPAAVQDVTVRFGRHSERVGCPTGRTGSSCHPEQFGRPWWGKISRLFTHKEEKRGEVWRIAGCAVGRGKRTKATKKRAAGPVWMGVFPSFLGSKRGESPLWSGLDRFSPVYEKKYFSRGLRGNALLDWLGTFSSCVLRSGESPSKISGKMPEMDRLARVGSDWLVLRKGLAFLAGGICGRAMLRAPLRAPIWTGLGAVGGSRLLGLARISSHYGSASSPRRLRGGDRNCGLW
jgi:hypothetical protein